MSVSWGKVLWCEDCDEIMHWDRHSEIWTCPGCGQKTTGPETPVHR